MNDGSFFVCARIVPLAERNRWRMRKEKCRNNEQFAKVNAWNDPPRLRYSLIIARPLFGLNSPIEPHPGIILSSWSMLPNKWPEYVSAPAFHSRNQFYCCVLSLREIGICLDFAKVNVFRSTRNHFHRASLPFSIFPPSSLNERINGCAGVPCYY